MNCQIFLRCRTVFFLAEHGVSPRKRAEHQAVPGSQNFVVEMRANAFGPRGGHFLFGGGEQSDLGRAPCSLRGRGRVARPERLDHAQNILSRQRVRMTVVNEIALVGDAEMADRHIEFLDGEQFRKLVFRPAIKFSFVSFAVGVFGGIKPAVRMRHVAQDVIKDVAHSVGVACVAADEKRVEIKLRELRVVVEHLLEMRHEPFGVHRVARKAAAELVVDAAGGHAVARVQDHARGLVVVKTFCATQQK